MNLLLESAMPNIAFQGAQASGASLARLRPWTRTLASLLIVPSLSAGQAVYSDQWKDYYSTIVRQEPAFGPGVPLEPSVVSRSPHEFATAKLTRTDGAKVSYSKETAYILVESRHFPPVHIEVRFFRAITLSWATDRILIIRRDIGHIAGIEEVLDVVDKKWLSRQSVVYGRE